MSLLVQLLLVGAGGCFGAIARYAISSIVQRTAGLFPAGTLAVNLLGCLLFGLLSELALTRSFFTPSARLLIFTGFLGAFTTYSTFSNDVVGLLQSEHEGLALFHLGAHIVFGLSAIWVGQLAARALT